MVIRRPHTAILNWVVGGSYATGKLSGGISMNLPIKCRIVDTVGEITGIDGRKMGITYRVFIDTVDISRVDQTTLTITFNGTEHKILRAIQRQSYLKLFL